MSYTGRVNPYSIEFITTIPNLSTVVLEKAGPYNRPIAISWSSGRAETKEELREFIEMLQSLEELILIKEIFNDKSISAIQESGQSSSPEANQGRS